MRLRRLQAKGRMPPLPLAPSAIFALFRHFQLP
jgi:hypothetical protein